jgi:hypothetical protein
VLYHPLINGEPCLIGSREEYDRIRARIEAASAHLGVSRKVHSQTAQEGRKRITQLQSVSEATIRYVQYNTKMSISEVATYAYWTCRQRHKRKQQKGTTGTTAVGAFKDQVIEQLTVFFGDQPAKWKTNKKVMSALKASPMWSDWIAQEKNELQMFHLICHIIQDRRP